VKSQPAFWAPASIRRRRAEFPGRVSAIVLDRGKRGTLVFDDHGRLTSSTEAISYHQFRAWSMSGPRPPPADPGILIADMLRRLLQIRFRLGAPWWLGERGRHYADDI